MRIHLFLPLIFIFLNGCAEKTANVSPFITLKIYHTNDIHSHLIPNNLGQGGLAYLASVLKLVRQEEPQSLILDAGDMYRKGHLPARKSQDEVMADMVSQIPYYDARAVGNNEIKVGIERLIRWSKKKETAPLLSANFLNREGQPVFNPYYIFSRFGLKVGVLGSTTEKTFEDTEGSEVQPDPKKDKHSPYQVANAETSLRPLVLKLRPQVDVLILLSHDTLNENKLLAKNFPQIDLIVAGHSHILTPELKSQGPSLMVEAGEYGQHLGLVTLVYDKTTHKVVTEESTSWPIGPDYQIADKKIEEAISVAYKKYAPEASEKIGEAPSSLIQLRADSPFEGSLHDWVVDVIREKSQSDVALINRAMLRENLVKGPISTDNLFLSAPYNDEIAVVTLSRTLFDKILKEQIQRYFDSEGVFPFAFSHLKATLVVNSETNTIKNIKLIFETQKNLLTVAMPMYIIKHCENFFPGKYCPWPQGTVKGSVTETLEEDIRKRKLIKAPEGNRIAVTIDE